MYLDRSIRGKLEGANSSSRKVAIHQGFRSDDGAITKQKRIYVGALVQRTNISKVSNSIVRDYTQIHNMVERARSGYEFRPAVRQMVEEITNQNIGNRIVRPSTPLMLIPEHKLLSPSEAISDHMLLPTLSVQEMQRINEAR